MRVTAAAIGADHPRDDEAATHAAVARIERREGGCGRAAGASLAAALKAPVLRGHAVTRRGAAGKGRSLQLEVALGELLLHVDVAQRVEGEARPVRDAAAVGQARVVH